MGGRKPNRVARKFSDSEIHRNEKIFYRQKASQEVYLTVNPDCFS